MEILDEVGGIYRDQGLKVREAVRVGPAEKEVSDAGGEDSSIEGSKRSSHASSSSTFERSIGAFGSIMSAFLPPKPQPALTVEEFLKKLCISGDQRAALLLPFADLGEPSMELLSTMEDDDLIAAGLNKFQMKGWKNLVSKQA